MNIFVTGASGSIGHQLLGTLQEKNWTIKALSRTKLPEVSEDHIQWIQGDLLNERDVASALKGEVDVVFHLAALTHSHRADDYYYFNVEGMRILLQAAKKNNVKKIIYVSTQAVGREGGAYSHSKLLAEELLRCSGIPWVIFRPAEVYGTGGRDPIVDMFKKVGRSRWMPVFAKEEIKFCPVYIDDVINAMIKSIDSDESIGKIYTLAGPQVLTFDQLIDEMATLYGKECQKISFPVYVVKAGVRLMCFFRWESIVYDQISRLMLRKSFDITQARQDLDFYPRTLKEGLRILNG